MSKQGRAGFEKRAICSDGSAGAEQFFFVHELDVLSQRMICHKLPNLIR